MFHPFDSLSGDEQTRWLQFGKPFSKSKLHLNICITLRKAILLFIFVSFYSITPNPISFELKNTYTNGNKITKKDSERIINILRKLAIAVENQNAEEIVKYISQEKGAYLDIKGLWEYETILEEIKKEDSYLEVYFFNHEKLVKQKQSENVLTVRELLQKSGGIEVDLFFESKTTCEGKLRFKKNKKLEKDMNNPYFIKVKGKWYIYRLF